MLYICIYWGVRPKNGDLRTDPEPVSIGLYSVFLLYLYPAAVNGGD